MAAIKSMDASIVIRTRNEGATIEKTLQRIKGQEFTGRYEVIIVDSGSTDSTLTIVAKYGLKLVEIPGKEFTYGRALNIGADAAKGRIILNLSAHAIPVDSRWLISLVEEFTSPEVAGVYGRQLSLGNVNPFDAFRNESFFGRSEKRFNRENRTALRHIHFSNSNCALRRDVWRQFKFDEDVAYAEDVLWQKAVISAGYSIVYAPAAAVYHTHPVHLQTAFRNSRNCAYALASVAGKRRSKPLVFHDLALFLALMASGLYRNLSYILKKNHLDFLKVAPIYVLAERLGWLVGRIAYRVAKA